MKAFRWTRFNRSVRVMLENGATVQEIKDDCRRIFDEHNPDARLSERAMALADLFRNVDEVASRVS